MIQDGDAPADSPMRSSNYSSSEPTSHLRFVERDGRHILQQMFEVKTYDCETLDCMLTGEWRDVPVEKAP